MSVLVVTGVMHGKTSWLNRPLYENIVKGCNVCTKGSLRSLDYHSYAVKVSLIDPANGDGV